VYQAEVVQDDSAAAPQNHRIASQRLTEEILRRQSASTSVGVLGQN
jgi:hypothetical protein